MNKIIIFMLGLVSLLSSLASMAEPICQTTNKVCSAPNQTRTVGGQRIYKDCWEWQTRSVCRETTEEPLCNTLKGQGCFQVSSKCTSVDANGLCTNQKLEMSCGGSASSTAAVNTSNSTCESVKYCENGECSSLTAPADKDMAQVVAMLETAREIGTYMDADSLTIFNGEAGRCRLGYGGINEGCCTKKPMRGGSGGRFGSVNQLAMKGMYSAAKYGFDYAKYKATPYVHDALYAAKSWFSQGAAGAASGVSSSAVGNAASVPNFNISYMGFGWSSGGAAAVNGATPLFSSAGSGSFLNGFYFSPTGLALAVAMYVVQEVLICSPTQEEATLSMRRGANLCLPAGTYCSKKVLGACIRKSEGHCCYNSTIAKIFNQQGRQQLYGTVNFGDPKNPVCTGFTVTEFQKIDMSKIDFSEFYSQVMADNGNFDGTVADQNFWTDRASDRISKLENDPKYADGNLSQSREAQDIKTRDENQQYQKEITGSAPTAPKNTTIGISQDDAEGATDLTDAQIAALVKAEQEREEKERKEKEQLSSYPSSGSTP
ncbi:hypothetical protein BKE30_13690 [Alkanindiges hydrocarboniclasticus]|uniref:Conjugal transfer mating pair stabilization protein TraN n=1 Tax=Alkanindiges hydrocarboniclasticus TaxID=1907941 RepID=A0A1S8CT93_9GAMM|nr:conjugal transfer protein TraN [Alkanindiges hydrocarboniclasticus]ONG37856.1 hypothetical protein BKE30_13690 [Alkanindiges hydrocarboniclasticus]